MTAEVTGMISIIIPTKNEPYINQLIEDIRAKVKEEHEIIVVDKSDSPPKLARARLLLQKTDGLGNAVLEGIKESKGEFVVMMDGDGSHDPSYINQMLERIKDSDIVIASKYVPGGKTEDYASRIFVSRVFNAVIAAFLGLKVKDLMSGYAMFRKEIFGMIALKPKGYKLLLEIVYKSKKACNARVCEVPMHFLKRKAGKSKVGFNIAGFREVWRIFLICMSLKFGKK